MGSDTGSYQLISCRASSLYVLIAFGVVALFIQLTRLTIAYLTQWRLDRRVRALNRISSTFQPDLTVVIPLKGWEPSLPDLLRSLAHQRYDGSIIPIVVVDEQHPEIRQLESIAGVRVVRFTLPAGWTGSDKNLRLLRGLRETHTEWVMFLDADAQISVDFLRYRMAVHAREPVPELSFSLPLYAHADNAAAAFLAAFTNHSNVALYLAASALIRLETAIGPSMVIRRRDAFLPTQLEHFQQLGSAYDHSLGQAYGTSGRLVALSAEPIVVTIPRPEWRDVLRQIMRWVMSVKTAKRIIRWPTWCVLIVSSSVSLIPFTLTTIGLFSALLGNVLVACTAAGFAIASMELEAIGLMIVEQRLLSRRCFGFPWRHLIFVPLALLSQPILFATALIKRRIEWRGAIIGR